MSLVILVGYPQYMGGRMSRNDELAEFRFQILSDAMGKYIADNKGMYPDSPQDLKTYFDTDEKIPFCGDTSSGYIYGCNFGFNSYRLTAKPLIKGKTGSRSFTREKDRLVYQEAAKTGSQTAAPADVSSRTIVIEEDSVRTSRPILKGDPSKLRLVPSTEEDGTE